MIMEDDVKRELDRIWERQESMNEKLDRILEQVTENRIRVAMTSAVLGFLGGAVPVITAIILKVIR
jgi:hypothetical protein